MNCRFDGSESVVIVAAQKRTLGGRELQLPCMSSLTSKTSTQKFFLRVLQVIIQLREDTRRANKKAKQTGGRLSKSLSFYTEASSNPLRTFPPFILKLSIESLLPLSDKDSFTGLSRFILYLFPGSTSLGSASSIQAAVRQLEAEADAIIQMVREGQRARRLQQAPPPSSSASSSAAAAASAAVAVAGSSAPSTSATNNPPAGMASAATVSMGRTDSRQTATDCTHPHTHPHPCCS